MGDIDMAEVRIQHSKDTVSLKVDPHCEGFVIGSPLYMACEDYDEKPRLDEFLKKHSELRWVSATPQLLYEYFIDYLRSVRTVRPEYFDLPISMLKPLIFELCHRRDFHGFHLTHESMRDFLPLSKYETLLDFEESSDDWRDDIREYLANFSKVMVNGVLDWSARSYEMHGYCTMLIAEALMTGSRKGGSGRDYRLAHAEIHHDIQRPIAGFCSYLMNGNINVEVSFDPPADPIAA
jgi:hypothetical protein